MIDTVEILEVKNSIGALVKLLRKRNEHSQQELADLLDLSRITIQNIEKGKNFTADTLLTIMKHYNLLGLINEGVVKYHKNVQVIKSLY